MTGSRHSSATHSVAERGVRVIYSTPGAPPRVVHIPILRVWVLAVVLLSLTIWSSFSAWFIFRSAPASVAASVANEANSPKTPINTQTTGAQAEPANVAVAREQIVSTSNNEASPVSVSQAEPSTTSPLLIPEGVLEPVTGSGLMLDLLRTTWNDGSLTVAFTVQNKTNNLAAGRIFARGVFAGANGEELVKAFPETFTNTEQFPATGGVPYAARMQVAKQLKLDVGSPAELTVLELYFVNDAGELDAHFRLP